jgi:excinuclease UvrABC nuclease subunit
MIKGEIIYRIWYGDKIVYLGRTRQNLQQRIRGHFFAKPRHRKIDIFAVTKIDYAEFKTQADMYLYEIYYINKFKPPLNVDDVAKDELTISLPEVKWNLFRCDLMDKWKEQISPIQNAKMYNRRWGPISKLKKEMKGEEIIEARKT